VMRPTNCTPSITIATLPLSRILRTTLREARGCKVSSRSVIALLTGSRKRTNAVLNADKQIRFVQKPHQCTIVQDWYLRHIGNSHPVVRGQQRVRRTDGDDAPILVASGDQIA